MNKYLLILLLFFSYETTFSDFLFKDNAQINIVYQTSYKVPFDSCGIICRNYETNKLDTFFHCEGWNCVAVQDENNVWLIRYVPDTFRVILYFKNKTITSTLLNKNGLNSYYRLLVTDSEIKDVTPIFKTSYSKYFSALLITILIELIVGLIYFRRRHSFIKSSVHYLHKSFYPSTSLDYLRKFCWFWLWAFNR